VAGGVGILTLVLALWTAAREPRRGVRGLAWGALAAVAAQAVLGGLTVRWMLPTAVSVAHACLAQTFLCLLVALAYATSREWLAVTPGALEDRTGLRGASGLLASLVYVQLVLGAIMRHLDSRSWSGSRLAIPDFPLSLGRVVPPLDSAAVAIHFAHRIGALLVLGAAVLLARRAHRLANPLFTRPALGLLGLVVLQIALGATTVLTGKGVLPATAHVANGAAVLGASVFLGLRAFRRLHPSPVGAFTGVTHPAAP
jgi:cytochrome c oxidase assembly protein subunit 15